MSFRSKRVRDLLHEGVYFFAESRKRITESCTLNKMQRSSQTCLKTVRIHALTEKNEFLHFNFISPRIDFSCKKLRKLTFLKYLRLSLATAINFRGNMQNRSNRCFIEISIEYGLEGGRQIYSTSSFISDKEVSRKFFDLNY